MKPKVIFLIGPPLSGKDTYLQNNMERFLDYVIISRDDILLSLHNNSNYNEAFKTINPKIVDRILRESIERCQKENKNTVINMTNLTKKSRRRHLSNFPSQNWDRIAIVFPKLDQKEYENRNRIRKDKENKFIPSEVLQSMITNWEEITSDEGFDTIIKL